MDVTTFTAKFNADTFPFSDFGVKLADLPGIDPLAVALKLKMIGVEVAQKILDGSLGDVVVNVKLQFAMISGWVSYGHSPAAMWLVLTVIAVAGVTCCWLGRGWFTRGDRKSVV